ncbi:MAG: hypothetical protein H0U74_22110 [Bradymonadaceae bacterium]|nr:hypothetical protein [Lujinxingiaceae bacterium]
MNKLTTSAIAALLLLAIAATGCDKPAAPTNADSSERVVEARPEPAAADEPEANSDEGSQWVTSKTYGVKFRVPEEWTVTTTDEGVSTTSPDGTTTVVLVGSESENMIQGALNDLKSKLEIKDVRFEKSGLTTVNGLAGSRGSGAAVVVQQDGDQEIQFIAYALRVGKHTVTLMIFSQAEMYEAQKDIIDGIAQTFTKA